MKAVLKEDMIIHVSERGDSEIGAIPRKKKRVGLERLRWTGKAIVDLADLSEIWVRPLGSGFFELHAVDVPGAQPVAMTYADRKKLVMDQGVVRLKTAQEAQADEKAAAVSLAKAELHAGLRRSAGRIEEQLALALKLIYLLVRYVKTGDQEAGRVIDRILPDIAETFPDDKIEPELAAAVNDMRHQVQAYYDKLATLQSPPRSSYESKEQQSGSKV